jgi:serine/threonine protein kinase/tetratricopeptide (TPR) repeat protein
VKRIGPYRLLQLIGEGGMGEVWLAEQVEPRRRVAIKVIKAGMDTKQVVARFESERQALALMDHPAIAKVFDGGSTAEGRPYFVMEYVAGVPITEHCDTHKLSTNSRLELFTEVCQGVQHAHQKAIIHRDLKPSNILVALVDAHAQPKIIDFGIAKATGYRLTDKTLFTGVGELIGTPEYMSPEQADLTGQDIDTRTDIYSLGVILYQLLTGELPFGSKELRSSSYEELRRKLREVEPPRPSTKLNTLVDGAADTARKRDTDPGVLRRQLEGDLDAITMKALEKERARRYGTPSELAADIGRHLCNEPVLARPPSTAYRLRKYVMRHRVGVWVALGLVSLLVLFAATMAVQARRIALERDRANVERDRANRESAVATHVSNFLTHMFDVSDPSEARGNSITAREILDRASKDIETGLGKDPALQARMMLTIGRVYWSLGLLARAQSLLERALDLRRATLGPDHVDTLRAASALGLVYWKQGRRPDAERLMADTLERKRRLFGGENDVTLNEMNNLALVFFDKGRLHDAESLHRYVLGVRRRRLGADHADTLSSAHNLAEVYLRANRLPDAEELLRTTLEARSRVLGPDHPTTLDTMADLGILLLQQHRLAESEQLFRETLKAQHRVLGPEHPGALGNANNLGEVLTQEGRVAEGEEMLREAVETERRLLGPEHPLTLDGTVNLAGSYVRHGHLAEGERLLRETLAVQSRLPAVDNPDRARTLSELALAALQRGQPTRALEVLEEAFAHGLTPDSVNAIATDPSWDSVRGNPRFARLMARASNEP